MTRGRIVLLAGIALLAIGFLALPPFIESSIQGVQPGLTQPVPADARAAHDRLRIVDWHTDSLLWKRDLLERSDRGHVDLPRLIEGNVAVQAFTIVTKSPVGQNYESNEATFDMNTLLAIFQRWPIATWNSRYERAAYQARKFERFSKQSRGQLVLIRDREDLDMLLARRARGERVVGGLLGIEGGHALDGELVHLDRLYGMGLRMVGLQHFFDNRLGGSLHGVTKGGLTEFGRSVVRRTEALHGIVDVAHSSPAVVDDVLAMATRPVVVSHTGVYGACETPRNLRDDQMQRIAEHGGLIAMGYWDGAVCDITPAGVVRAIRHAIDLVGVDHVALGSDFDGGTTTAFDTSGLASLTHAMREANFRDDEIAKVMGENSLRLLRDLLPPRGVALDRSVR